MGVSVQSAHCLEVEDEEEEVGTDALDGCAHGHLVEEGRLVKAHWRLQSQ